MWPNGRLETLTMILKKPDALEIAKTLCILKRPRSDDIIRGALNIMLISIVGEIRNVDPELKSFININSYKDLTRLQPRQAQGPIAKNLRIDLGDLPITKLKRLQKAATLFNQGKSLESSKAFSSCATQLEKDNHCFWAAISRENEGKSLLSFSELPKKQKFAAEKIVKAKEALSKAANTFELEAKIYDNVNGIFLAERARSNKKWCKSLVNDLRRHSYLVSLKNR